MSIGVLSFFISSDEVHGVCVISSFTLSGLWFVWNSGFMYFVRLLGAS